MNISNFYSTSSVHRNWLFVLLFLIKLLMIIAFSLIVLDNNYLFFLFLFETTVIEFCLFFNKIKVRCLILPIIIAHIAQLVNFFIVGSLIDVTTIVNFNEFNDIGFKTIVKTIGYFVIISFLYIPYFIFKTVNITKYSYLSFLFLIFMCCYPDFPIRNFVVSSFNSYKMLTFSQQPKNKDYFLRDKVDFGNSLVSERDFNIILIFAEGTSSKVISKQVTPNTVYFMEKSLRFSHYFNHTAATYRGIRGQLASGYQMKGGYYSNNNGLAQIKKEELKDVISSNTNLVTILNDNNYKTIFVSPHKTENPFNNFIKYIGFSQINSEDRVLSDKNTYALLYDTICKAANTGNKFFIASYILGTHEGQDSPDMKYGDGKDPYLNKFYNQDYWFGDFIKKLCNTDILKNTVLIFTADHSSYPSIGFRHAFNSTAKYFVDEIPLIIYTKNILPQEIDAKNKNSLSLAPTILDILNITAGENYFLGNSLFTNSKNEFSHISNIGFDYFDTSSGSVVKITPSTKLKNTIEKFFLIFG